MRLNAIFEFNLVFKNEKQFFNSRISSQSEQSVSDQNTS